MSFPPEYIAGGDAYTEGEPRSNNPYPASADGTSSFYWWHRGWDDARSDDEEIDLKIEEARHDRR